MKFFVQSVLCYKRQLPVVKGFYPEHHLVQKIWKTKTFWRESSDLNFDFEKQRA